MTISELIERLECLRREHGDVLVLHHDDYDDFMVEEVSYCDVEYENGSVWRPAHVVLEGMTYPAVKSIV